MDYCDVGSSSDSDDERGPYPNPSAVLDSDEEERYENQRILKMLSIKSSKSTKGHQKIMDFEAEMEAELDRRASAVEHEGGMEHQRSLSRSSSSSSLNCLSLSLSQSLPAVTGQAALTQTPGPSCLKRTSSGKAAGRKKTVNFANDNDSMDATPGTEGAAPVPPAAPGGEFYDKIYFDSDESEGEEDQVKETRKRKREFKTNDDLFYDPNSDAADQAWIDKQRRNYISPNKNANVKVGKHLAAVAAEAEASTTTTSEGTTTTKKKSAEENSNALPSTDAVLNCPACFSLLCMDCQRHEFYAGQYRAMFVTNCKIDRSETLTVPLKGKNKKGKKSRKEETSEVPSNLTGSSCDMFYPVRCKVCNSQVAVYDKEEIYHFFNCLASHP